MAPITLVYSALMIALGVGVYFATGTPSVTALIPAFFGAAFLLLGLLALKSAMRKHAMHAAAALALIAFVVPAGRLVLKGIGDKPLAAAEQGIMALLSAGFLALCVRSFIAARKARAQRET